MIISSSATVDGERGGGVWDYISPSRLNLWLQCPLAWKFRYLDGIRTPATPGLLIGKQVHYGLELFYRHRQLNVTLDASQVTARVVAGWDEAVADSGVSFPSEKEAVKARTQVERLLRAYLHRLGTGPTERPPWAVETTLSFPLVEPASGESLGIPLLGVIDLVLDEPAGPVVCDFKTASSATPPGELSHEVQLSCYAYLLRCATGQSEQRLEIRSLVKTKTPQVLVHAFQRRTEAHFRRLFATLRGYLDDLDRGRFLYRPGWHCGMCPYRENHCHRWTP